MRYSALDCSETTNSLNLKLGTQVQFHMRMTTYIFHLTLTFDREKNCVKNQRQKVNSTAARRQADARLLSMAISANCSSIPRATLHAEACTEDPSDQSPCLNTQRYFHISCYYPSRPGRAHRVMTALKCHDDEKSVIDVSRPQSVRV